MTIKHVVTKQSVPNGGQLSWVSLEVESIVEPHNAMYTASKCIISISWWHIVGISLQVVHSGFPNKIFVQFSMSCSTTHIGICTTPLKGLNQRKNHQQKNEVIEEPTISSHQWLVVAKLSKMS